jgi:CHAD domain-containing protein
MPLDPKKLDKPFVKLRKLVRKVSKAPTQEEVHNIRTNARRVEASLEALQLDRKRKGRRVLRAITPIRKKAGDVRDMDVLTGFAATLANDGHDQCLTKLLEHLGAERARYAGKLRKTIARRRQETGDSLKTCATFIGKKVGENVEKQAGVKQREWPLNATAAALGISEELGNWPRLSGQNLHAFRLKVKELRNVLKLSGDKENELMERLGEVKDQIGEWHDWTELEGLAREVLEDCSNCDVIAEVQRTARNKFATALKNAQQLRSRYFGSEGGKRKRSRRKVAIKQPVLQATAELAA